METGLDEERLLFHLYRCRGLFEDGQKRKARTELELARRLAPHDPRVEELAQVLAGGEMTLLGVAPAPSRPPPGGRPAPITVRPAAPASVPPPRAASTSSPPSPAGPPSPRREPTVPPPSSRGGAALPSIPPPIAPLPTQSEPGTGILSHPSGILLVRTERDLACRLSIIEAVSVAAFATDASSMRVPLMRRTRTKTLDEPLGGADDPLVTLIAPADLGLSPPPGHLLLLLSVGLESVYLREELVQAFETSLTYENGRLANDQGDPIRMVHFRGEGVVVLRSHAPLQRLEVRADRGVLARIDAVVGWRGRLLPVRGGPTGNPPVIGAGTGGGVAPPSVGFSGEGILLLRRSGPS